MWSLNEIHQKNMTQDNDAACYYWTSIHDSRKKELKRRLTKNCQVQQERRWSDQQDLSFLVEEIPFVLRSSLLISLNVTIFNNADLKISQCQVTITTSLREQHSSPLTCHFDTEYTDPEATSA